MNENTTIKFWKNIFLILIVVGMILGFSPSTFNTKLIVDSGEKSKSIKKLVQRSTRTVNIKDGFTLCSEHICIPKEYSSTSMPKLTFDKNASPIEIVVEFTDVEVLEVNDIKQTVAIKMHLGVHWNDPRLVSLENGTSDQLISLDVGMVNHLWIPDLEIWNLQDIRHFRVTKMLAGLWVTNVTQLYYSQSILATVFCHMNYDWYPLDRQRCKFEVGSYAHDTSAILFDTKLNNKAIKNNKKNDYISNIEKLKKEDMVRFWSSTQANYSIAGFQIRFDRHTTKYIIQYYLTSGLFVCVSWSSFLIEPDIVAGRMMLLTTLFLVLINLFNNLTSNAPNSEVLNAASAWILSCIIFVFAALIAYAGLLLRKKIRKYKNKKKILRNWKEKASTPMPSLIEDNIDFACLITFPAIFIIFNIVYWIFAYPWI